MPPKKTQQKKSVQPRQSPRKNSSFRARQSSDDSSSEEDFLTRPGLISSSDLSPSPSRQRSSLKSPRKSVSFVLSPLRQSTRLNQSSIVQPSFKSRSRRKQTRPVKRGKRVLQEIKKLQGSYHKIIPSAPFQRTVREIMLSQRGQMVDWRVTGKALEALQESAEMYLTQVFEDSNLLTYHRQRCTLNVKDIKLAMYLREVR